MNDNQKAELRRLAEAAMSPMYIGDREAQSQERIRARSAFDAMARPSTVLSLLDENAQLRAEVEALCVAFVECIDSLHGEMLQKFGGQLPEYMHPVTRRDYDRDQAELAEYRALLAAQVIPK